MAHISINLLPIEFKQEEAKRTKFYKVQIIGVAAILVTAALASLTVTLRILQSQNISQIQTRVRASEQKISELKDTQATLLLLKNRLTAINQYLGIPSKQVQMYQLINDLIPVAFSVTSLSVDKNGDISILAAAPDGASLDSFMTDLTADGNNQNAISQVSLDSISRGRDGIYRLSIKIKPK